MELFSFEVILYMIHFLSKEKVRNCAPSLSLKSHKYFEKPISDPHPDGSYLYRVRMMKALLIVAAYTYTKSLLNDESALDGRSKTYIGSSP